jgi:phenylacetate-CoA ligase
MSYLPEIETKTSDEITSYQFGRLKELLPYVASNSPFYRNQFHLSKFDPESLSSLEEFRKLRPTTKDDLQQHNWDFLCIPKSAIAEYTSTSGTLGKPVTIALSANDLERLAYNEAISFACAGGSSKDLYQLMLTLDRQFMAGIAYYHGIRKLGASVVRVGPGVPAMQWDAIERLKPTALVAVPSFLYKLIEFARDHNIDLNKSSVRKAICIGESLRNNDFSLSVIGKKIAVSWDIQLYSTYASTEMQTAFTECGEGKGGHLHPELLIVELLDENNNPVPDGEPGEVTITTLGVEAMPLIRYKTGDIAVGHYGACQCGRTTMRLGPVLGRKQNLIKLKGTTIYPPGIFEILNDIPFVTDYVVEVYTNETGTDDLKLHLTTKEIHHEEATRQLNSLFQSRLRVLPKIDFVLPAALEKLQSGKGERKIRRFIDSRDAYHSG